MWSPAKPAQASSVNVIHFITQRAFPTSVPSVFQPHDLQHLHFPQLFDSSVRDWREASYRSACEAAAVVIAMSEWGKRDLIDKYGLEEDKIAVVPWASSLPTYPAPSPETIDPIVRMYNLPKEFLLYPAITWPHKNHVGLLRALSRLRADGLAIPLVLTGAPNALTANVMRTAAALGLRDQVLHLGYVPGEHLGVLYGRARAVVYPSLFEGWGIPVVEAFESGVPVACSAVASLPEVAGDAALLFDPASDESIAAAIRAIWCDEPLRETLIQRGLQRAGRFSWSRTAQMFRCVYAVLAGRHLSEEEMEILRGFWPGFATAKARKNAWG